MELVFNPWMTQDLIIAKEVNLKTLTFLKKLNTKNILVKNQDVFEASEFLVSLSCKRLNEGYSLFSGRHEIFDCWWERAVKRKLVFGLEQQDYKNHKVITRFTIPYNSRKFMSTDQFTEEVLKNKRPLIISILHNKNYDKLASMLVDISYTPLYNKRNYHPTSFIDSTADYLKALEEE